MVLHHRHRRPLYSFLQPNTSPVISQSGSRAVSDRLNKIHQRTSPSGKKLSSFQTKANKRKTSFKTEWDFPSSSEVKNLPANVRDPSSSPGGGNGNPLRYSGLGNPTARGAWWAAVQGVTKIWTGLSMQACKTECFLLFGQNTRFVPSTSCLAALSGAGTCREPVLGVVESPKGTWDAVIDLQWADFRRILSGTGSESTFITSQPDAPSLLQRFPE